MDLGRTARARPTGGRLHGVVPDGDGRQWKEVSNKDGLVVEQRELPGSAYYEFRVTTDTDVSPGALCDGIYEWSSVGKDHEQLKDRRLIEDRGDTRIVYDEISTPAPVQSRSAWFARCLKTPPLRVHSIRSDEVPLFARASRVA